jgi:hypothetical protein
MFFKEMYLSYRITPVYLQTGSKKRKLQRSSKLLFIFLEAFSDSFVAPSKPLLNRRRAPELSSTKWRPHRRAYC